MRKVPNMSHLPLLAQVQAVMLEVEVLQPQVVEEPVVVVHSLVLVAAGATLEEVLVLEEAALPEVQEPEVMASLAPVVEA